jgi:hypothetical protein
MMTRMSKNTVNYKYMLEFLCVEHGYTYTNVVFYMTYVKCNSAKKSLKIQEKVSLSFEFPTETLFRILSKNE